MRRLPRLDADDRKALGTIGVGLLLAACAVLVLLTLSLTAGEMVHLFRWAAS